MSTNVSDPKPEAATTPPVPKRITNAQTVCNEKNAKGKLCNGHLKQLRTAGEASEVHLRGDDVLSKCQTCGALYMGPPLGHVRDPYKQSRFVEAELSALLQAAGGTLPVIKKDERGVFVMAESAPAHAPTPPAAAKATPAAQPKAQVPAAKATAQPAAPKAGAEPNRQLFRRSTYAGVKDTGPVAGESFADKVARLRAVAAGAKQRSEEGGGEHGAVAEVAAVAATPDVTTETTEAASPAPEVAAPLAPAAHKPTGQADRTLMKRSTYGDVTDTGPVPGETFAQKVERLSKVAAAAKQRADGG